MDLSVQKTVKNRLRNCFENWYSEQILEQRKTNSKLNNSTPVEMPFMKMKALISVAGEMLSGILLLIQT